MSDNTVRKQYPHTKDGKGQFVNEIMAYPHLDNCPFVLSLIRIDRENLTFYIPYMPVRPSKNSRTQDIIKSYCKILKSKYHLERLYPISWSNVVASTSNKLYLIDFGGIPFHFRPGGKKIKWKVI